MSSADRLAQIADVVRDALAGTFEDIAPGVAEVPPADLMRAGGDALDGIDPPAVVAHVAPADAVTGPAVLTLTVAGTRKLAAVLGVIDEEEAECSGDDVGDRELSAFRETTAKVTAAVGSAVTALADRDAAFRPASVRVAERTTDLRLGIEVGTHAAVVEFTLLGETGRFVLLLPAGLGAEPNSLATAAAAAPVLGDHPLSGALSSVNVRVWAELGRARMPTGQVVGLPAGAIVELDHDADDAVELYVDGQCYATGRLVVTDDDSWGVRIERVLARG